METQTVPNQEQVPSQTASPAPVTKPNFLNFALIILIFLLLGFTGFLYYQNQLLKEVIARYQQEQQPPIVEDNTPEPSPLPEVLDPRVEQFIQDGCISYFDGCNSCSVDQEGRTACTLMACEALGEPKCLEYKANN